MRIAVVGGLERHESEIARRASSAGHQVEFHRGRVGGRHAEELESIVERSDLVIIVTEVNSHGAVFIAKKAAHRAGRPSIIVRTCGPSRFQLVIDALQRAQQPAAIAQMVGGC